ncbi:MAG: GAF domain-containing protein [Chloroflexota bacterium]
MTVSASDSRERLVSLARCAAVLNAERDPERAFERICHEALALFGVQSVVLWEQDGAELVAVRIEGIEATNIRSCRVSIDSDAVIACRCFRERAQILEKNVPEFTIDSPPGFRIEPAACLLCVPLIHQEEVLGVIELRNRDEVDHFTLDDLETVAIFASMAAVVMTNARLSKEMEKRAREATVFSEMVRIASSGMNLGEKSEAFAQKLRDLIQFDRVSLALIEDGDKVRRVLVSGVATEKFGPNSVEQLEGRGLEWLIKNRRTLVIPDIEKTQVFPVERFLSEKGLRSSIRVPLMDSGAVLGSINLWSKTPDAYGPREIELLEQVAGQIAGVFAHAQTVGTQRLILNRLYSLHRITDAALSTLDLDNLLESLLDRCIEIVGADAGSVLLLDEEEQQLSIVGARWIEGETPWDYRRKLGEGVAGKVAQDGKPRLVQEVDRENPEDVTISRARGIHSILAVPLLAREKTLGVLRLDSRQPGRFDRQHLQMMEVAAERMALAIDNARLLKEAQERATYEALIHRIAAAIGGSLDLDRVMDTAVKELLAATKASRCAVVLVDPRGELGFLRWEARADEVPSLGFQSNYLGDDPCIIAMMSNSQPIAIEDIWSSPLPESLLNLAKQLDIRSVLATPLFRGSEPIGGLEIFQYGRTRRWAKREMELLQAVASQLALAVENARLYGQTDEKLRARVRELGSLVRLGRAVSEQLSPNLVISRAVEEGVRALDADCCSISMLDADTGAVTIGKTYDREGGFGTGAEVGISPGQYPGHLDGFQLGKETILKIDDPRTLETEKGYLQRLGMATAILLPLEVGDKPMGIAFFGRRTGRPVFTDDDLALARAVVGQVAVSLENARLFQEVQKQKSRIEALLSSMSEGVYATDTNRCISIVNPWFELMLGHRAADVIGRPCRDVLRHSDEDGLPICDKACPLEAVLTNGKPFEPTMLFAQTAWGSRLPTVVSIAPIRNELGETEGAVSVSRDVTREWQMDKLKSNIISVVSHEFRTPLTSVLGFSEYLLMHEPPKKERRRSLELIHQEALRMETLVNDFLDVSKLEAGKISLELQPLDPTEVVENAVAAMVARTGQHQLVSDIESRLPKIEADPERLEQILSNLISNAIKYSSRDTPVIVRARAASVGADDRLVIGKDGKERWVVFTVEDRGVGIPSDQLQDIFTPFHRVEGDMTRRIRGTGLGLSIVKSLVELHSGRLWVESEVGVGSKFHVAFLAMSDGEL